MACTAYIFKEDFDRLTTREFHHAIQRQKGGSLFGQWTSTGNPVVHFAMSFAASQNERDKMGKDLYDKFRVCHIGEWRPTPSHGRDDHHEMNARGALWRPDFPARFLVLDVSRGDIVPFLFERQTPKGRGLLERLSGKNPFNQTGLLERRPEPARNYNPPGYTVQPTAVGQSGWSPARQAEPQPQEAYTSDGQWYSSDKGNEALRKVRDEFKQIALGGKVDMSRDTTTHNISLSFTESRHKRKWEVQFPEKFPNDGAILIKNPGTYAPRREQQGPNDKATKAAKNIISRIQSLS